MNKVTISVIAKKAGVSSATVSRVLNNSPLVKGETVIRVRQVMEQLEYHPNELARSLRSNATKTIGVVVSNILNPFFTAVVRGIEDVANEANYNIMLCNSDEKPEKEIQYINALIAKQIDGLIIASSEMIHNYDEIIGTKPVVFIDRIPSEMNKSKYDMVLVENRKGAAEAVGHLIDQGYKRIGIITGQNQSTTGSERLRGYKDALKAAGLRIDHNLIRIGDFLGYNGYALASDLIQNTDCDAIFSANNMILLGVLRALGELNVSVPEDIGLITFDDMEWMQYCSPHISAIAQPTYEIGSAAVKMLLDRIHGGKTPPREVMLGVRLIERQSSMRIKQVH